MADKPIERRLAAILAADVVGYSRLMAANEERTLNALRQHRRDFFDPTIARHGGRIFKAMGDGFLVEFASVLNAARCAVEIQRAMPERNLGVPEDRHIKFRIGLNLGDVIIDGEDVYGEGVNLAARLEGLAAPGGIACSAAVRSHIGNRLDLEFLDQGEKAVKNIDEPIHVYFISLGGAALVRPDDQRHSQPGGEKPSVAVLPFANMSADTEQEFFADGITEDIITDLSKVSGLFVISRNSVFTLKGKPTNLQETARRLGASYVVEGSVRKSGNRVRITAQLIEGATDTHLWADRYDRDLTDIFAIQDEIAKAIVEQLKVRLLPDERKAIETKATDKVEAYTLYLRGRQLYNRRTKSALLMAREYFSEAIKVDPHYARAYSGLADCNSFLKSMHGIEVPIEELLAVTDKALALDPNLAEAHASRGSALIGVNNRLEAHAAFERALALDPNSFEVNDEYARFCMIVGNHELAAKHFARALEIHPDDYNSPSLLASLCESLGRLKERGDYARMALKRAERALALCPEDSKAAQLGAVDWAILGEREKAKEWLARALAIDPEDNMARYNAACTYSRLGEFDQAIDLLEVYLRKIGPDAKAWFKNDPDLVPIRSHPRYQALLRLAD